MAEIQPKCCLPSRKMMTKTSVSYEAINISRKTLVIFSLTGWPLGKGAFLWKTSFKVSCFLGVSIVEELDADDVGPLFEGEGSIG